MKTLRVLFAFLALAGAACPAGAGQDYVTVAPGGKATLKDAEIIAALDRVDGKRLFADVDRMVSFGTRHTLTYGRKDLGSGRGIGPALDWVEGEFRTIANSSGGRMEVFRQEYGLPVTARTPDGGTCANVFAVLRAEPATARTLIVSGHIDSRVTDILNWQSDAPGANDDASGVAVVLECARLLAPLKFSCNLVFVAVSGEEQGLLGSKAFQEETRRRGWDVEAFVTNDIVGGDGAAERALDEHNRGHHDQVMALNTLRVFSEGVPANLPQDQARRLNRLGGEDDGPARQTARAFAETVTRGIPTLVRRIDRYGRGGDHIPFSEAGIAAIRITDSQENYDWQHQDVREENGKLFGDRVEFVSASHMAFVAHSNAAFLATLARAPARPAWVELDAALKHDAVLTWAEVPGATEYWVQVRSTHEPEWRVAYIARTPETATRSPKGPRRRGGDEVSALRIEGQPGVLRFTVRDHDGDGHIFAVRAISAGGHPGLPATPYWNPKP